MQYIIMGYLKKNINDNSINALNPKNRLQGDVPKKRINTTIDQELYLVLKSTGNISGTIEDLVKKSLLNLDSNFESQSLEIIDKLKVIMDKIDLKQTGYKSNGSGQLIKDLKDILSL
ncbi:hypothetical protein [Geminocystis herdmanii]|uniref:hypothetical protein n=1 Tax=Geminocystis herdmanii TaxID=669359 RepID=UPI000347BD7A|nr:hypothetical protein [Geminocystis herdmanii]